MSIRRALGASRGRIAHQFLMESLLLSATGCLFGLGLTAMSMDVVSGWLPDLSLPYWVDISLATPALALTAGLILLVTIIAGALPALRASNGNAPARLNDSCRGSTVRPLGGTGGRLVTAQIAFSCALLISAGLLVKSLIHLRSLDMGYDPKKVIAADIWLPESEYPEPEIRSRLFAEVLERASTLPGVRGASLARGVPGTGPTFTWKFEIQGEGYPTATVTADGVPISHGYFQVMGIELLQGRDFSPAESRLGSKPVLIVNETLARNHLGSNPIGRQVRIGGGNEDSPWLAVVGVVEDTYIGSYAGGIGMDEAPRGQMYISWGVLGYSAGTLLVGSERDPDQLIPEVRSLLRQVGHNVPLYNAARLSDVIEDSTWVFGLFGTVFAIFGGMALLMSAIGLYGVMAFAATQRRPEMSVRMALGADANSILALMLGEAGRRLLWGTGLGLLLSALLAQGIRVALFGVNTIDLTVYSTILVTIIGTGHWQPSCPPSAQPELTR